MCGGVLIIFDPIDNVRGRCRVRVKGGYLLPINNVVDLPGMFVDAWMYTKQSDVTPIFTLGTICAFVLEVNMFTGYWFQGSSGTKLMRSRPTFEAA